MSEPRSAEIRISDAERESAMAALGEHMSSGRLDIDEYGDRSAKVAAAKKRGELLALFEDLPAPHPVIDGAAAPPPAAPVAAQPAGQPVSRGASAVKQRVMGAAVPAAAIIACLLFFGMHLPWLVFLLPAAVVVFGGAIFGNDWNDHRSRQRALEHERRDRHRALERERRHQHRDDRWDHRDRHRGYRD